MKSITLRDIESAKKTLRISHGLLDDEIKECITACLNDLEISGVDTETQPASEVMQAVKLYCRWYYNFDGRGDGYREAYENLTIKLKLATVGDKLE